ncbi:IS3 family transposase [Aneurinibacillus migulanus]|uniref:IS3 family transposase n=2 Tax=Aneurinibacillus migulanus TaxID=47500 RepID=UPI0009434534|nr:hypothetical protein AMI01nite_33990 [Aneurinibacillus migulanus]
MTMPILNSFIVCLKKVVYIEAPSTRAEAQKHIFEYMTCFYNEKRIRFSIVDFTPNQYECIHSKSVT